jgi:HSP20 family protein
MNRLFRTFFDQPQPTECGGCGRRRIPALGLVESTDHYVLRADLPGAREEDLPAIAGQLPAERRSQQGYYLDRALGAFSRWLTLPDGVNTARAGLGWTTAR